MEERVGQKAGFEGENNSKKFELSSYSKAS